MAGGGGRHSGHVTAVIGCRNSRMIGKLLIVKDASGAFQSPLVTVLEAHRAPTLSTEKVFT